MKNNKNTYRLALFLSMFIPAALFADDARPDLPMSIINSIPELPASISNSVIDSNVLNGVSGRNAVNMASGDSNNQVNAAALAIDSNGLANANVLTRQYQNTSASTLPNLSTSDIGDNAFANSSGAISINQTSGIGNTQANGIAIGIGQQVNVMSESMLSNTTAEVGLSTSETDTGTRSATISDSAFSGARGLVQVNQSAGSGNSTANNFALQFELGTK